MNTTQGKITDPWPGRTLVASTEVAEVTGLTRWQIRAVEQAGTVQPVEKRGAAGRHQYTKDDALLLLVAAVTAVAAGLALVQVARVLRAAMDSGLVAELPVAA